MSEPLIVAPLRITVRAARVGLRLTRDLAERGLDVLDLLADALESVAGPEDEFADEAPARPAAPARPPARPDVPPAPEPPGPDPADVEVVDYDEPEPVEPIHVSEDAELVEEVAEPGAEEGAGASVTVDEPFPGFDALRAADVIATLRGSDAAQLAAIELYELSHRRRRTVLDAIAREARRPRGQ